ncbi:hypothetical protein NXX53_05960 [Bacteroides salyersiae]|nr:hypothetical protein [Bacteroides salyersiae]
MIVDILGSGVLRPKLKLLKKQPPQVTRCDFVNEVFDGYNGWEILIDIRCRKAHRRPHLSVEEQRRHQEQTQGDRPEDGH